VSITDTGSGSATRQQQAEAARMVGQYANSEFGEKPQSKLSFVSEQAPIRTIAHWEAAHRNVLADEPQLRGIIDNELLYGLRLTEDQQILDGTGSNEQLQGILRCPGIQSYLHPQYSPGFIAAGGAQYGNTGSAELASAVDDWNTAAGSASSARLYDTKADAIRRAITLAYLANYEPTGIIVNPADWEDIELTKNSQGTYLLAMSVAAGAEQRVWRVPVIDTPAIAQGTALVGAFGTGAQLYDREAASIRVSENHADFFVRNAVVVLAEERLALAVKRPESFVAITFDSSYSI
jgi:HK97 family phage major capsid protein